MLVHSTATDIDSYFGGEKMSYYNHSSPGSAATKTELAKYKGKMGRLVNAAALLNAIGSAGSDMKLPNIYIAPGKNSVIDLARFFVDGESLEYNAEIVDSNIAKVALEGSRLTVSGESEGFTSINIMVNGEKHHVLVTVRDGANSNGWM